MLIDEKQLKLMRKALSTCIGIPCSAIEGVDGAIEYVAGVMETKPLGKERGDTLIDSVLILKTIKIEWSEGKSGYAAWCPFCRVFHQHSPQEGSRVAHCSRSIYPGGEYYLERANFMICRDKGKRYKAVINEGR